MDTREKISAVLIALNEERNIGAALESLTWADEVLVVDGGSSDATRQQCENKGVRVVERRFTSYAEQKNFALDQASHDWIFSLDADERASSSLTSEIQTLAQAGFRVSGYRIPRLTYYMGRFIRSTAWYPDHQLRLFDRRRGRWQGLYVHESVKVTGPVEKLRGEILHYSYENLSDHVERMNRYAGLAALQMREAGRVARLWPIVAYPPFVFLKNYVVKRGYRDGSAGFVISLMNAFYVFLKYAKFWEQERSQPLDGV